MTGPTTSNTLKVTNKVARAVGAHVVEKMRNSGQKVSLDQTRILPSTMVNLGDGLYQVLANTFVTVQPVVSSVSPRHELVNSVVTIKKTQSNAQTLEAVKIPSLESASLSRK